MSQAAQTIAGIACAICISQGLAASLPDSVFIPEWKKEKEFFKNDFREAMRLASGPGECLAYDPSAQACALTAEEFHRELENFVSPGLDSSEKSGIIRRTAVDTARAQLAFHLLAGKFPLWRCEHGPLKDSLARSQRKAVVDMVREMRLFFGDAKLRKLYKQYYTAWFGSREEAYAWVLAASDSMLVDSLAAKTDSAGLGPIWELLPVSQLPREVQDRIRFSAPAFPRAPLRTPWGFLALRPGPSRKTPSIDFESAVPRLVFLAEEARGTKDPDDPDVMAYYQTHPERFVTPDTLSVRVWIRPAHAGESSRSAAAIRRAIHSGMAVEDTSALSSRVLDMVLDDAELPADFKDAVGRRPLGRDSALLGPIRSTYGVWYVRILHRRRGDHPRPRREVEGEIREILYGTAGADPWERAENARLSRERELLEAAANTRLNAENYPSRHELDSLASGSEGLKMGSRLSQDLPPAYRKREIDAMLGQPLAEARAREQMSRWIRKDLHFR
ncbi:MAG TPA: peptidylprolyl isomerase, partial [Fibrobacteria bacterium]|nr:peptidylprolyl isomerase [Fibrobacteria bacterium]